MITNTREKVIRNAQFITKVFEEPKQAAASTQKFIRDTLMEDVKASEIMPIWDLTPSDLDRSPTDNNPLIYCDKEPDCTAYTMPIWGDTITKIKHGTRFTIYLNRIVSDRIVLDRAQMSSYAFDLDQFLQDKIVKRLGDPHDQGFVDTIDAVIAANPLTHRNIVTSFDATGFRIGMTSILSRRVPFSKMLMCQELYARAVELPASAVDIQAKEFFDNGVDFNSPKLWGMPVVLTLKNYIFDPTKVWFFTTADSSATKNYMGLHVRYEQPTLFLETRGPKVEFEAYTMIGMGLGNTNGIHEVVFNL